MPTQPGFNECTMLTRTLPDLTSWSFTISSLTNAGPVVGVAKGASVVPAACGVEADFCVGMAVGIGVGAAFAPFVGAVVGFVTGGLEVGTVAFSVGAATFGAHAASTTVSTNTVLKKSLVFIFFSPFRA